MPTKKVAIVVGGGSGIAADSARKLNEDGYNLAVMSSSGKGKALGESFGGIGYTGSNLDPDDLKQLVALTMDRWGRVDVVINGAGHGPKGPVLEITDESWHLGMDVYLMNVVRMCRLITPIMLEGGGGSIVNISTYAAFEPEALFPTSGVFRSALAAYTKLYVDKYAADNIRMNNVMPGFTDSLPETEERRQRIPMGRYANVSEISELVSFLASERSSYIIGQNIRVDGGITRSV